jgi:hypothetical protein
MNQFDLGWLVGILEGEGSFVIRHREKYVGQAAITVTLVERDRHLLKKLKHITGLGYIVGPYSHKNPNHQPFSRWCVSDFEGCKKLIEQISPYMSERRMEQINKLVEFLKDKKGRNVKFND